MNVDVLVSQIDRFLTAVSERQRDDPDLIEMAEVVIDIARAVRSDLVGAFEQDDMSSSMSGRRTWDSSQRAARRLRAHLLNRQEVHAALGPEGPVISAAALHPWVWNAAAAHWDAGHHDVAVREAARAVLIHVRAHAGILDSDGYPLINMLFSEQEPYVGAPRFRVWRPAGSTDDTLQNLQRGLASLGRACVQLIRNAETHDETGTNETEALEMLATLSLFARRAESCRVERVGDSGSE